MTWRSGVMILVGLAAGCGGALEGEDLPQTLAEDFWRTSVASELDPGSLGELIAIPVGTVVLGDWTFDGSRFVAEPCTEGRGGTMRLRVGGFRLMRTEVTNRVYASCVARGACAPPDGDLSREPMPGAWSDASTANKPVALSKELAARFCELHGGKLPTEAQFARASAGDTSSFGIGRLADAFVRCWQGRPEPLCEDIKRSTLSFPAVLDGAGRYRPMPDVETVPWDVGPYGHRDLFAGAAEWIRPQFASYEECRDAVWAESLPEITSTPPQIAWHLAGALADGAYRPEFGPYEVAGIVRFGEPPQYYNGFRCAFPPAP